MKHPSSVYLKVKEIKFINYDWLWKQFQNDNLVFGYSNNPPSTANIVEKMRIDNGTGTVSIPSTGVFTVGAGITMDAASGIITATKFVGDGSELTGISGGGGSGVSQAKATAISMIFG